MHVFILHITVICGITPQKTAMLKYAVLSINLFSYNILRLQRILVSGLLQVFSVWDAGREDTILIIDVHIYFYLCLCLSLMSSPE
jgi:hypothetical protein